MGGLSEDLRFAFRTLGKTPGFTAVAVVVLGLGIGPNVAIFSFLNALFLRPFPFDHLGSLVTVWETHPQPGRQGDAAHAGSGLRNAVAPADYVDWKKSDSFRHFAAYRYRDLTLSAVDEPERVRGVLATADFFPMLRVRPMLGRVFLPEEETPGRDAVALLSHALWKNRFGADPGIVGRTCTLNGRTHTVVGVMPPDFEFPLGGVRVWTPLAMTPEDRVERSRLSYLVLAELGPGVTRERARAELNGIAARLERQHPDTNAGRRVALVPLGEQQVGFTGTFALLFQAAAAFVLLITCANMANLLLARAAGRQKEVAVRAAMGATSWRLARQLLVESLVLSLLGGGFAVWLARSGVSSIRDSLPSGIAQWVGGWSAIGIDARALAYTLGLAAVTSLLFGLVPAHQASRAQLTGLLKEGGRGSGAGGRARLRGLLVISELTLALALLVGAGLMVRGFLGLLDVYQGYDPEGVMTMRVSLPAERYPAPQAARFFESLLERVGATPGVESAAGVSHLPADLGPVPGGPFSIEGRPVLAVGELPVADFQSVSPDYFRTLRVPMLGGRPFGEQDGAAAPPVVIVSDSVARRFWPDEDPVGRRVKLGPPDGTEPWRRIVGVARDVKQYWFDREPRLTLYFPHLQSPRPAMTVVVRASGDPQAMAAVVRAQVRGLDPGQPIHEVRTLADAVRQSVAFVRLSAVLMVILGVLALVLSALGVYGVMAYHVSRRTHEIGIRVAVGAAQPEIVRLVMGQALKLTALGLATGLPLAAGLASAMSSRLFGVVRPDPLGFVAVVLGLTAVAALASYLPARRAAGLDPVIALRRE